MSRAQSAGSSERIAGAADARKAGESHRLFAELYDELRRMAASRLAAERSGHTLEPTALVHEVFMRFARRGPEGESGAPRGWENRRHFFGAASEAMRRILVEHARARTRLKRGGAAGPLPLRESHLAVAGPVPDDRVLAVHEALEALEAVDPMKAEIVKLRFFAGMGHDEIARLLDVNEKTVRRHWAVAKVWLFQRIREEA